MSFAKTAPIGCSRCVFCPATSVWWCVLVRLVFPRPSESFTCVYVRSAATTPRFRGEVWLMTRCLTFKQASEHRRRINTRTKAETQPRGGTLHLYHSLSKWVLMLVPLILHLYRLCVKTDRVTGGSLAHANVFLEIIKFSFGWFWVFILKSKC